MTGAYDEILSFMSLESAAQLYTRDLFTTITLVQLSLYCSRYSSMAMSNCGIYYLGGGCG